VGFFIIIIFFHPYLTVLKGLVFKNPLGRPERISGLFPSQQGRGREVGFSPSFYAGYATTYFCCQSQRDVNKNEHFLLSSINWNSFVRKKYLLFSIYLYSVAFLYLYTVLQILYTRVFLVFCVMHLTEWRIFNLYHRY
jgi:hypothetical protein